MLCHYTLSTRLCNVPWGTADNKRQICCHCTCWKTSPCPLQFQRMCWRRSWMQKMQNDIAATIWILPAMWQATQQLKGRTFKKHWSRSWLVSVQTKPLTMSNRARTSQNRKSKKQLISLKKLTKSTGTHLLQRVFSQAVTSKLDVHRDRDFTPLCQGAQLRQGSTPSPLLLFLCFIEMASFVLYFHSQFPRIHWRREGWYLVFLVIHQHFFPSGSMAGNTPPPWCGDRES